MRSAGVPEGGFAGSIPRARKEVISGTAHVPSVEKPGEFNRVVLRFLAGVAA